MGSLEAARPGDGDGAVPGSRSFPETAKLRASPAWEKLGCPGSAGGSVQPPSAGWGARSPVLLEEGLREAAGHRDGAVRKTWGTVTEEMETFHLLKSLSWSYWHFGWLSAAWQRVQKVWCDTPIWTLPRHVDRVLLKSSSSNHRYLQGCLNFYLHRKFCNLVFEYISAVIVVLQFLVCWCIKMIHRMWLYMHVTLLDRLWSLSFITALPLISLFWRLVSCFWKAIRIEFICYSFGGGSVWITSWAGILTSFFLGLQW